MRHAIRTASRSRCIRRAPRSGYPVGMGTRHYRFGRFRLNPQARELFDGAERVNLPVSTIDSLIYLIEHRDRPVGRDELAAAVWGRVDVSEVSLSHAIMRLRRLLGDTGNEQRVIRTVPRLGYRWVMDGRSSRSRRRRVARARPSPHRRAERVDAAPESTAARPSPKTRALLALAALVDRRCACAACVLAARAQRRARIRDHGDTAAGDGAAGRRSTRRPTRPGCGSASWISSRSQLASRRHRDGAERNGRRAGQRAQRRRDRDRSRRISGRADRAADRDAARGGWTVRSKRAMRSATLRVEATRRRSDRKPAARRADELLIKLGHVPPRADAARAIERRAGDVAPARQRGRAFRAARRRARSDRARAPPALAGDAGDRAERSQGRILRAATTAQPRDRSKRCSRACPPMRRPALRARALNTLGAAYFREGRIDEAGKRVRRIDPAASSTRNEPTCSRMRTSAAAASRASACAWTKRPRTTAARARCSSSATMRSASRRSISISA